MPKIVLFVFSLFLLLQTGFVKAQTSEESSAPSYIDGDSIVEPGTNRRTPLYRYGYNDRDHSFEENAKNIAVVYGLTWVFYPLVQPKVFEVHHGLETYKHNFGKVVFDKDEPIWNLFVHPISGSQLYLLYRSLGYSKMSAFGMTTISSSLFEFTVEILTEPASVQDLYQTPVLGTVLGLGLENLSMYLLNSDTTLGTIVGHAINPATLFPFYEGRTLIIPKYEQEDKGAMMKVEFGF